VAEKPDPLVRVPVLPRKLIVMEATKTTDYIQ